MKSTSSRRARAIHRLKPVVDLIRRTDAFDDTDWVFELKHDGFRALAYIDAATCRLVSRYQHRFDEFDALAKAIAKVLADRRAVLDGEIVCLDAEGRPQFYELLARKGRPYYYAFDLLWLDGEDFRDRPLLERKAKLRSLVPEKDSRLLYVDHIEASGVALFERVCEKDLEGIIAKRKKGLYREGTTWYKIKNAAYSQAEGRGEVFDRRRSRPRLHP